MEGNNIKKQLLEFLYDFLIFTILYILKILKIMTIANFSTYLKLLQNLSPDQYWQVKDVMNVLDLKKIVTLILEEDIVENCAHCGSTEFVKNGRVSDLQRYRCKTCARCFNQLTGTPLAGLKKKGRWLDYSDCLNNGYSVRKASEEVKVSVKTSFKWRHRFLKNANKLYAPKLNGIIETMETSFKYSEKGGAIPLNRPRRHGEQVYVLTSVDRDRLATTPIIDMLRSENIKQELKSIIAKDSLFCTNNTKSIIDFANQHELNCMKVDSNSVKLKNEFLHVNNVGKYIFSLKDWLKRFRGVSTKYLHNYLSWFRELDEYLMDIPIRTLLVRAKSIKSYPYNPILEKTNVKMRD
jgi:transposase-like protein